MTSIHRTAYPYFRRAQKFRSKDLESSFTLSDDELNYVKRNNRNDESRFGFAVQLKVFQYLGYFTVLHDIPAEIINHIGEQLSINKNTSFYYDHDRSSRRHRERICEHLSITRWGNKPRESPESPINPARHHAIDVALQAAKTLNNPADIINVVIETLRNDHFELPSFDQLSRLVKHARYLVNRGLFSIIVEQLSPQQKETLDQLLLQKSDKYRTGFNDIKRLPKKPTITHFKELIKHHDWLFSLFSAKRYVAHITKKKLQQFAEQTKSLDVSDIKDFSPQKRYALMTCLLDQAQCQAKDALAITCCKTIAKLHKHADLKKADVAKSLKEKTKKLVTVFSEILGEIKSEPHDLAMLEKVFKKIEAGGGVETLQADCDDVIAVNGDHSLDYILPFYANKRSALFRLLDALELRSATQDNTLMNAIQLIRENESSRAIYLSIDLDLSFTTKHWKKLILCKENGKKVIHRRYLEMSVFTHLAEDLDSNDIFIEGADSFADHRAGMLPHDVCREKMDEYCRSVNLPSNAAEFVRHMRNQLADVAQRVDKNYPTIDEFVIDEKNNPVLKKRGPKKRSSGAIALAQIIRDRLPERNIVDILCNTHHYTGWANAFGPISGSDPKIDSAIERYIITSFAYGSGMGPTQAAQHIRSDITAHMISWINRRHVNPNMLDQARTLLINFANTFPLLTAWGDGMSCAADGNLRELREDNLIAEFHMRYNRKGGIGYHHVANNYIALFSTFIPCGVWEAIAIIEGLLKNNSDIQPDTIHADTQGQSTVVFALAYLLGFKLMPRIRNWKDLNFYRPDKTAKYKHINSLFSETINWQLIETHWEDMMQVVLSIKAGVISSSSLLRKLSSKSRKNKLYFAFQQLGYVVRTQFLLEYISDVELREAITDATNKVESYNRLSEWASFGSLILVASNDEDEMEKAIKYNDILTNSIILQNIVDMTDIFGQLILEGYDVKKEDVGSLSPYLTGQIKRFGDYDVDLMIVPKDPSGSRRLVLW